MSLSAIVKALYEGVAPLGKQVRRTGLAADLTGVATVPLFTITGGDVLVTGFYGKVTTLIGGGAATLILVHTPAGGAANAMCATSISIAADAVDTIYTWDGTLAGVLQPLGVAAVGVGNCVASFSASGKGVILVAGVMGLAVAVVSTGVIDWTMHYVALEPGASVVAA